MTNFVEEYDEEIERRFAELLEEIGHSGRFIDSFINPNHRYFFEKLDIRPKYDINDALQIVDPMEGNYPRWTWYRGNNKIKKAGVPIRYTDDMIEELSRCADDILYFSQKFMTIRTIDFGKILIPLRDYQKQWLRALTHPDFQEYAFNASRQSSKSTVMTIFLLHNMLFKDDYAQAIVAQRQGTAHEIFGRVAMAYEELPFWMQKGSKVWNRGSVYLEGDSSVYAGPSTPDALRGVTLNTLMIDESAFIKRQDDFFKAVKPVISSGKTSKLIMTSTPNGKRGNFYRAVMNARKGKGTYFTMTVPWWLVPGRDQAWYDKQVANDGLTSVRQEYGAEFIGTALSLIDNDTLERIDAEEINDNYIEEDEDVRIFEAPIEDAQYYMVVDTAEGKGLDNSTFTIFRVDKQPYKQVATFCRNDVSPVVFALYCKRWAEHYNTAKLVVENNNTSGGLVAYEVYMTHEYENVYLGNTLNETGIGIRTTSRVKSIGCSTLKAMLKKQKLIIQDSRTYDELVNFEAKGSSFEAADDSTDDLVQNLWLFAYLTTDPEFEGTSEGESITDDIYEEEFEEINNMQLPTIEQFGDRTGGFW